MADSITGKTDIDAVSMVVIAQQAQMYLQQESILAPTVTNYSDLVIPGSDSVGIPRAGGFTVGSKTSETAVEAQAITFAKDAIALDNHRVVQFLIEEIATTQARVRVVEENVLRASKDLAVDVDKYIIAQLKLASSSAPDHQLVFIDTSTDVIAKGDILAAKALLEAQYLAFNDCYIGVGPEKYNELLSLSDFVDASKFGNGDPIQKGVIGTIYGGKVIVHTDFEDFMCTWHPSSVGYAFDRNLTFQSESDLANLATRYSLDMRHGVAVLDSGKRNVLTDSTN